MIFTASNYHFENLKNQQLEKGPHLTKQVPKCIKCHKYPASALGGKRTRNKYGQQKFICKECLS